MASFKLCQRPMFHICMNTLSKPNKKIYGASQSLDKGMIYVRIID